MKVTSRERPEQLLKCVKAYIELANNTKDMVWLFTFDEDDKSLDMNFHHQLTELIQATGQGEKSLSVTGKSLGKIHAINRDIDNEFFKSNWDILLNISDDQIPEVKGYDDKIRAAMPDHLDASLWFFDGCQKNINTQEILGKVYFERTGKIYNDSYKSLFSDNEATEVAQRLGKLIKINECIIRHHHPAIMSTVQMDDLYRRNEGFWKHDENIYKIRKAANFYI